jgi:Tol biopolymer transport system component
MNEEKQLTSWKAIGAYLERDARTVRRWEKEEGLPVHRHTHKRGSSVYAYPAEIDTWRASRKVVPEPAPVRSLWRWPAFALTMLLCLIMVGNGVRSVSAQTKQASRQVWVGNGAEVNTEGSVSADGRFLSFTDQATGDLAIRNLDTGENRRLTDNPNTDWLNFADNSSISPDGRQVAYAWYTDTEDSYDLRVIPATGEKAARRVIYGNKDVSYMQPFGWLPDGSGVFAYLSRLDQTHQIALIRSDGSGTTVLKSFDWRSSAGMSVSPDGRYIAYDFPPREDNPEHDIYILAADGGREVRAVQSPADDLMVGWAPDGKSLLFSSDRTGSQGLWSIGVANGEPVGQPALLKKDIGRITPLGLSSRGTLYYGMQTGIRDVYTVSIDPKTLKPVSEPVLAAQRFLGTNEGADWSPDGKYLAYASRRGSARRSPSVLTIHTLADGSERDVLMKLAYIAGYYGIRWSRDGRSILVRGVDRKGREGLYKVDVQTGEAVSMVSGLVSPPEWSPDGRTMYFLRGGQAATIMALDTRDNTEREVYQKLGGNFSPFTISPDGKNLAFVENADDHSKGQHILVFPTGGGKPRVLVEGPRIQGYVLLQWTPDGKSLLFTKPGLEVWRVNVSTGEQSLVDRYAATGGGLRAGRISPDGRQFSYTYGGATAEIWALENFLPAPAAGK